jgi:predicted kinase
MATPDATLHMLCGKIAAGKSTLATALATAPKTITISEDHWVSRLYPEITTFEDYCRCSARLREAAAPHIESILKAGLSVALDFHANTRASRAWMRSIVERSGARHQLHYLDVPDELCRQRLRARNAAGSHEYAASDAEFDAITAYFVAPTADEGSNVVVRKAS